MGDSGSWMKRQERTANGTEYFHCVSRVVDRRMASRNSKKRNSPDHAYEEFYSLRILSCCLMTNQLNDPEETARHTHLCHPRSFLHRNHHRPPPNIGALVWPGRLAPGG